MLQTKAWPQDWMPLDEFYSLREWTLETAQHVSKAERAYEIWLHWHDERIMIADARSGLPNWCPLCPEAWGETLNRFQVPPEYRPFNDYAEALERLTTWIKDHALGRWMLAPQMVGDLHIKSYTRLVQGEPHSTLLRLLEQLKLRQDFGIRVCIHTRSESLGFINPSPTFVPWSCVTTESEDECPLCLMGLPSWTPQTLDSDSLPEDIQALDNARLWETVHNIHVNGVHVFDPADIECPQCRDIAKWRQSQGPKEPAGVALTVF